MPSESLRKTAEQEAGLNCMGAAGVYSFFIKPTPDSKLGMSAFSLDVRVPLSHCPSTKKPSSPAFLPFHELPVSEDLQVQGQLDVHQLLVLLHQVSHILLALLEGLF